MVLTYLGTFDVVHSSAWSQIIGSSAASSLHETYHFLRMLFLHHPIYLLQSVGTALLLPPRVGDSLVEGVHKWRTRDREYLEGHSGYASCRHCGGWVDVEVHLKKDKDKKMTKRLLVTTVAN